MLTRQAHPVLPPSSQKSPPPKAEASSAPRSRPNASAFARTRARIGDRRNAVFIVPPTKRDVSHLGTYGGRPRGDWRGPFEPMKAPLFAQDRPGSKSRCYISSTVRIAISEHRVANSLTASLRSAIGCPIPTGLYKLLVIDRCRRTTQSSIGNSMQGRLVEAKSRRDGD
jgi:hypothetical protein